MTPPTEGVKAYSEEEIERLREADSYQVDDVNGTRRWLATHTALLAEVARLAERVDAYTLAFRGAVDRIGAIAQEARHHTNHAGAKMVLRKAENAEEWAREATVALDGGAK